MYVASHSLDAASDVKVSELTKNCHDGQVDVAEAARHDVSFVKR